MRVGWIAFTFLAVLCLRAGTLALAQDDSALRITEIYYDTPGRDEDEEWFEIANLGPAPLSLAGYKIGDEEQLGRGEGMARFPDDATIAPGQVLVIARSAAGFRALFGRNPDFELRDTDPTVPDLPRSAVWATGEIALANDGDELLLAGPDNVIRDAVNYGDSTTFFIPAVPLVRTGHSLARIPATCDSDSAAEWQPLPVPNPGTVVTGGECAAPPDPLAGLDLLPIGTIQGSGDTSPYLDQAVSFAGIATGTYEDRNTQGITYYTLFVQDLPGVADGDPATSDAIAVFLGRRRPRLALGERVLVSGRVTEFYGFTEIDDAGLTLTPLPWEGAAPPLLAPVSLSLPLSPAGWEALEGMRVALPAARVAGPTHTGCGFSVLLDTMVGDRLLRERAEDAFPALLPVLHTSDISCEGFPQVKVGDRVTGLAGPLVYHFDEFKLVQQDPATIVIDAAPLPPLPRAAAPDAGQIAVATFNLHDYLETGPVPPAVKQQKLAHTISAALGCPTLLGVQEVQSRPLLQALVDALAETCGFTYAIAHRDSADVRGIDVALLADPRRVSVTAATLRQTCTTLATGIDDPAAACPAGEDPLFSRPPLQVELLVDGEPYTIFVNHFKSKRGGEAETAPRRLAQARHLNSLVAPFLAAGANARVLVMGDFNDYALSPALLAMTTETGYLENVLLSLPPEERYTYNFGGASQLLDGLLLSPAALARVAHVEIVHANADYPAGWALDPAIPFHSSDHDIPYLLLQLPAPPDITPTPVPVISAQDPISSTLDPRPDATTPALNPTPSPQLASTTRPLWPWLVGTTLALLLLLLVLRLRSR